MIVRRAARVTTRRGKEGQGPLEVARRGSPRIAQPSEMGVVGYTVLAIVYINISSLSNTLKCESSESVYIGYVHPTSTQTYK
jgi:hypothetical protein